MDKITNKGELIKFIEKIILTSDPTIKLDSPEKPSKIGEFAPQFYPQAIKGRISFDFTYRGGKKCQKILN